MPHTLNTGLAVPAGVIRSVLDAEGVGYESEEEAGGVSATATWGQSGAR